MPDLPDLADCGFIRVPADGPLWMTCERCRKSDHFWLQADRIRCRCGADYSHAVRPDGSQVPSADLVFVPFADGPKALADLAWDPVRIGVLVAVVTLGVGGLWFALS